VLICRDPSTTFVNRAGYSAMKWSRVEQSVPKPRGERRRVLAEVDRPSAEPVLFNAGGFLNMQ
jgi:hypothetical protein